MNTIKSNLIPLEKGVPLDARTVVANTAAIASIQNPYVGLVIYCIASDAYYKVTAVSETTSAGVTSTAVSAYEAYVPDHTHTMSAIPGLQAALETLAPHYTINGIQPDANNAFTLTCQQLNAAPAEHVHQLAEYIGLMERFETKSDVTHTHNDVRKITVGTTDLTGDVTIEGSANVSVTPTQTGISIAVSPYTQDSSLQISDANTQSQKPVRIFEGTQAEWTALTKNAQYKYIAFIRG